MERGLASRGVARPESFTSENIRSLDTALTEYRWTFLNRTAVRNGRTVDLSTTELRLLRHLILRRDNVLAREELLNDVWGYRATNTRTLDVHIASLRHKLEECPREPRHILTVRGKGYLFRE